MLRQIVHFLFFHPSRFRIGNRSEPIAAYNQFILFFFFILIHTFFPNE
jgi:hypothetical protein